MVQNQLSIKAFTVDLWSVLALFVEEYPDLDKNRTKDLVKISIPKL